jgi:hypothetical protein
MVAIQFHRLSSVSDPSVSEPTILQRFVGIALELLNIAIILIGIKQIECYCHSKK